MSPAASPAEQPAHDLRSSRPGRSLAAIVMAAGEGTRMRSDRPKPLHRLCGRPMVLHVLDALASTGATRAVMVVGHGADRVTKALTAEAPSGMPLEFVTQTVQRGTGDAVAVALTAFDADAEDDVLIMPGDQPLFRPETLRSLVERHRSADAAVTVLTARVPDPTGLGRIVRDRQGRVRRIVEHRDATDEERTIDEINTSVYCCRLDVLAPALRRLSPDNSQGEYYLTDVVEVLASAGYPVAASTVEDRAEAAGVNDRMQLAVAERELRRRTNARLMAAGVTMLDPDQTYVDASVVVGRDVTVFPGALLQGRTVIGAGAEIGPGCRLVDCRVGEGATLEQVVARGAVIGDGAVVGPFAALGHGAVIEAGVRTGPFHTAGVLA
jgi:bifunctional UDP-N-acetylglucosamine pyrophosphorylase/glucosamine-1-phosphate N-acetyltransferase